MINTTVYHVAGMKPKGCLMTDMPKDKRSFDTVKIRIPLLYGMSEL